MSLLGLPSYYKKIIEKIKDETEIYNIYDVFNEKINKNICLKVLDKEDKKIKELEEELGVNFFSEQMKKEQKILKGIHSDYIIQLYDVSNNDKYMILETEYFDKSLYEYMSGSPRFEKGDKNIYKTIIRNLVKALKELKEKNIIHRNLKPQNIYIIDSEVDLADEFQIKLANFDCAIYTNEVQNSEPMGSLIYSSPEIINNSTYDEKSDYWSLGVILYELYFGFTPFGQNPNINTILKILEGKESLIYRKSNIPTLDILFNRLLRINPEERMSLEELCNLVEGKDFMEEKDISENKKYHKYKYAEILQKIRKEKEIKYKYGIEEKGKPYLAEVNSFQKLFKLINYENLIHINEELFQKEPLINNIIYYDEINDKKFTDKVYADCDIFEENTTGAFIFCSDFDSLKIVKSEIYEKYKSNQKYKFNLITTGNAWENKINEFLSKDSEFKAFINNVCIYCTDIKKYNKLSKDYDIVKQVWCTPDPVIKFIRKTSSKNIDPFPSTKLVTYDSYMNYYKILHKMISCYYDEFNKNIFDANYSKMEKLIKKEKESRRFNESQEKLKDSFKTFDESEEINKANSIIKEYTQNTFYGPLNKWLRSLDLKYYFTIAYFAARLIYNLNKYGQSSNKYFNENHNEYSIYRGMVISYIDLLPYKRAENKIISFPSFTSTSRDLDYGNIFAKRGLYKPSKETKDFSVLFYLKNIWEKNWISNGVDIKDIADNKEEEILFQAFSFFYVDKIEINLKERTADIYLETIGKKEILEEKIKQGKEIKYNSLKKIMEMV